MNRIETKNLVLRKAVLSDLDKIYRNVWADAELAEYMFWKPTPTYAEAVERLNRTVIYQKENMAYFICLKETDEPIGFAGIRKECDEVYSESGICIASGYQNKGFGKEVLKALMKIAFEVLDAKQFLYSFVRQNDKSRRICMHWDFRYVSSANEYREWDSRLFTIDTYMLNRERYFLQAKEGDTSVGN